jgi:glycosyltransferase involved in cell wall biosynthesis
MSGCAVCIIVENLPVPGDRRVWQEARTLTEAGYSVSIICPKGHGFKRSRELLDGIEIYRHSIWEARGRRGYFLEYGWALGMEFVLALKVYARTRFKILQACNPPDTIFLIALFFKLFGVRFVFDQHDLTPELYETKFGRKDLLYRFACLAERLTYRAADVVIATNESFRRIALDRGGVCPNRTAVVRGCPNIDDFQLPPPRPHLKQGRTYLVVYVGVMASQDGVNLLLESISHLVIDQGRDDTLFVLIGFGPDLDGLKARATARGLDAWVKFTGPLFGNSLLPYLATADVAVAPDPSNALNDNLTMVKILEYMACGLPVVLYDLVEGRRSAGDAALYAKDNDPVDFAGQIAKLLDSQSLRRRLGDIGRQTIQESLNWKIERQKLLHAYETASRGGRSCEKREPVIPRGSSDAIQSQSLRR